MLNQVKQAEVVAQNEETAATPDYALMSSDVWEDIVDEEEMGIEYTCIQTYDRKKLKMKKHQRKKLKKKLMVKLRWSGKL